MFTDKKARCKPVLRHTHHVGRHHARAAALYQQLDHGQVAVGCRIVKRCALVLGCVRRSSTCVCQARVAFPAATECATTHHPGFPFAYRH
jgi:hypothetical protein